MNIAEIAKLAGVSSAAVSRYFNNGYISETKREAIRKVVEETGYRPSVQAQTLRTKKTMLVGVIIPKAASASMGRMVEGILSVLNESGYRMMLAVTQHDVEKEIEYLRTFDQKQVDGIILAATVITEKHEQVLKDLKVPVVIVGQKMPGYTCVYHDDYHAIYEMTDRVIRKGCKKLGYLGVTELDQAAGAERYRGFCDALRANGQEEQKQNYAIAEFSVESAYERFPELLERCPDLDAVICATDEIAIGVQQYLKEQGLMKSRSWVITGQGDSMLAKVAYPIVPTIHYCYFESGSKAVQALLSELNGNSEKVEEAEQALQSESPCLGYRIVTHGMEL